MRLGRKVALATSTLLAFSVFSVGGTTVLITYQQSVDSLNRTLDAIASEISQKSDPLSAALLLGDREVTIVYRQSDGSNLVLQESAGQLDSGHLITREIDLGFDEKLLIGVSTANVDALLEAQIPLVLGASFGLALVAGLVMLAILRTDISSIAALSKQASAISRGEKEDFHYPGRTREILELSESLSKMLGQLEQNQANLKDFLSDASHELKTPLTVIRGHLELLQRESLDSSHSQRVEKLHREALRMQSIINDLLSLARLESGEGFRGERVFIQNIVSEEIENLHLLQPEKKIQSLIPETFSIYGDQDLIVRLISNALTNFRMHALPSATCRISAKDMGNSSQIVIEDSGPGLPADFNYSPTARFRKAPQSSGTGLGISIMNGIMTTHGGSLELSRSELGGLRIVATFPNEERWRRKATGSSSPTSNA
jgi:two-component system OmpR family sensor kinase